MRDGVLGHRARSDGQHALVAAAGAGRAQAWELLEKARSVEVKTERERLWIDAIRAYFRDHDKVPVEQRLDATTRRCSSSRRSYPHDFEAQVYYALTLQASAPKSRHDLRQPVQVGGDARTALQEGSRSIPASRIT